MNKRNLLHIELMRIFAIYWVMFNHTGNLGFFLFSVTEKSFAYWLYLFISIACKFAVPLFFMISGALLLAKDESIKMLYTKRVLRMFTVLLVISVIYQLDATGFTIFPLQKFLIRFYSKNLSVALWYLYAYLALLMMLPLLRKLARNMTAQEFIYLAAISLCITGIIPILQYRLALDKVVMYGHLKGALFTSTSIVFFLMGYFFEHVLPEKYYTWRNALIGLCLSLLCIAICCYMTYFRAGIMGKCAEGISQAFHNSLIAIPTYTLYFTAKLFFMKRQISHRMGQAIGLLGSTTFGIYLLEGILRRETKIIFNSANVYIGAMPACLLWIAGALALGFIVTFLLKKIPLVAKYI